MASEASALALPREVEALLQEVAASHGLRSPKFHVESGSGARDGFSSTVHRVRISDEGQEGSGELSVICKTARPIFGSLMTRMYEIEAYMYETALPAMQEAAKLTEPLPWPRCEGAAVRGEPPLVMALADLRPQGFAMADRSATMDEPHCRLALRQLARFHAAGMALQLRRPAAFDALRRQLGDNVWAAAELRANMRPMNRAVQIVPDALASEFPAGGEEHSRLKAVFAALAEDSVALTGPTSGRGYTIIHNDLHVNNMMFQYDKTTGEATDCRLIDFQMAMYGNPAVDLVTILLVCTDQPLRDAHWDALLRGYHDEVVATLRAAGCPDTAYPWELLQEQLSVAAAYGLAMTPVYHYGLYSDDAAVAEMKAAMERIARGDDVALPLRLTLALRRRLAALVADVARWGWLPDADDLRRRLNDTAVRYTERRLLAGH